MTHGGGAIGNRAYNKKKDLAAAFGVSLTTVQNWANDPDFPGGVRGPWIESQVQLYLAAKGSPAAGDGGAGPHDNELSQAKRITALAKAKKASEEARRLELLNNKMAGLLIDREEAVREMSEIFATLRDRLLQLPTQVATSAPQEQKPELIRQTRRHVHALLEELASLAQRGFGDGGF